MLLWPRDGLIYARCCSLEIISLPAHPPASSRCSAAAATVGDKLVVFGGAAHWDADDGRFLNDTYVVDLAPVVATLAAVDPNAAAPVAVDA